MVVFGFIAILLLGLYPPWTITYIFKGPRVKLPMPQGGGGHYLTETYANSYEYGVGHKWLLRQPRWVKESDDEPEHYYQVDTSLLLVQWFLVSAATGVIVMFLGDRRQSPADRSDE